MKHPMWIINSILLCILVIMGSYIAITARKIIEEPRVKPLRPIAKPVYAEEKPKPKDLRYLYEKNDLFGTYVPVMDLKKPAPLSVPPVPQPPAPLPLYIQPERQVEFLEPLPLKVSGIIAHSIESKSQATLVNTRTQASSSYKVGDTVFDAYVVRIFPNKVILIRSNGQQETLYRSQTEAQKEMALFHKTSWQDVIKQTSDTSYNIYRKPFVDHVISLAHLIDALDATTAVIRGEPVGCRIGKMDPQSVGYFLGLRPGDIITDISGIAPISTTNKLKIYDKITSLPDNETFKVMILRNRAQLALEFTVSEDHNPGPKEAKKNAELEEKSMQPSASRPASVSNRSTIRSMSPKKMTEEQRKIKPSLHQKKTMDRRMMDHYGGYNSIN